MSELSCIKQAGIIESINAGTATVKFIQHAACSGCSAKMICGSSENDVNRVEVSVSNSEFTKGEEVNLMINRSLGIKAVMLAYIIPFVIVLVVLLVLSSLNFNELIVGIFSLGILIPYYFILSLNKHHLKKTFTFSISKVDNE